MGETDHVIPEDTNAQAMPFDFVINALLQHEKTISSLATVLEGILKKLGNVGYLDAEIQEIDASLSNIEKGISNFKLLLSNQKKPANFIGSLVTVECKQWEDFRVLAINAEITSFLLNEKENTLQVSAIKDAFMPTCKIDFPKELSPDRKLVKTWLSRMLNVTEDKIFEGSLLPS